MGLGVGGVGVDLDTVTLLAAALAVAEEAAAEAATAAILPVNVVVGRVCLLVLVSDTTLLAGDHVRGFVASE